MWLPVSVVPGTIGSVPVVKLYWQPRGVEVGVAVAVAVADGDPVGVGDGRSAGEIERADPQSPSNGASRGDVLIYEPESGVVGWIDVKSRIVAPARAACLRAVPSLIDPSPRVIWPGGSPSWRAV